MKNPDPFSTQIKPGDDFYAYVNQPWLDAHPIPESKAVYGAMHVLADDNVERLRALLEGAGSADETANVRLLRKMYRMGMDEAAIEGAGLEAVEPRLAEIAKLGSGDDILSYLATAHGRGEALLWHPSIEPDDKESRRYALRLHQGGLGLPDRDYYLETGEPFETIQARYTVF